MSRQAPGIRTQVGVQTPATVGSAARYTSWAAFTRKTSLVPQAIRVPGRLVAFAQVFVALDQSQRSPLLALVVDAAAATQRISPACFSPASARQVRPVAAKLT